MHRLQTVATIPLHHQNRCHTAFRASREINKCENLLGGHFLAKKFSIDFCRGH
jgi:hypothetical protein